MKSFFLFLLFILSVIANSYWGVWWLVGPLAALFIALDKRSGKTLFLYPLLISFIWFFIIVYKDYILGQGYTSQLLAKMIFSEESSPVLAIILPIFMVFLFSLMWSVVGYVFAKVPEKKEEFMFINRR